MRALTAAGTVLVLLAMGPCTAVPERRLPVEAPVPVPTRMAQCADRFEAELSDLDTAVARLERQADATAPAPPAPAPPAPAPPNEAHAKECER